MVDGMEKVKVFLDYNKDNIFKNLIQSENHFRNLKTNYDVGFANCIVKHLLDAEGESEEAISHSLYVEPEKAGKFRKFRDRLRKFRKKIQKEYVDPDEGIKEIRELRKEFESFNPEYDISKCESCRPEVLEELEKFLEIGEKSVKDLNTNIVIIDSKKNNGVNMRRLGLIVGSQFAGVGVRELGTYIDAAFGKTAAPSFSRPSTWIDIAGGLLMAVAPQFMRMSDTLTTALTIIGTQRIADRIVQLAKEYTAAPAGVRVVRPPVVRAVARPATPTVTGGLVKID